MIPEKDVGKFLVLIAMQIHAYVPVYIGDKTRWHIRMCLFSFYCCSIKFFILYDNVLDHAMAAGYS